MFDRDSVIDFLIIDDMTGIVDRKSYDYLHDLLRNGMIGYSNMTDEDLIKECEGRGISYLVGENDDGEV